MKWGLGVEKILDKIVDIGDTEGELFLKSTVPSKVKHNQVSPTKQSVLNI